MVKVFTLLAVLPLVGLAVTSPIVPRQSQQCYQNCVFRQCPTLSNFW